LEIGALGYVNSGHPRIIPPKITSSVYQPLKPIISVQFLVEKKPPSVHFFTAPKKATSIKNQETTTTVADCQSLLHGSDCWRVPNLLEGLADPQSSWDLGYPKKGHIHIIEMRK
jgi:hypothetical protein